MRKIWAGVVVAFVCGLAPGCGETPAPQGPPKITGPTTDPAGEVFSKPSKPAARPAGK